MLNGEPATLQASPAADQESNHMERTNSPASVIDPLARWRSGVTITPVSTVPNRHTIHNYYRTSPESPDGRWILYFASVTRDGHLGSLCLTDRESGEEKVLVENIVTEDAHRAACQQWVADGRFVVFHDFREDRWVVVTVDLDTGEEQVIAVDRQVGWVQPNASIVSLYGPHWEPDGFHDLELFDLESGKSWIPVTAEATREAFPTEIAEEFGDHAISICFPDISPDLTRVFYKLSAPKGGDFRSAAASHRQQLICFDLEQDRFLFLDRDWGHPNWHPDSRTILNVPNVLIDSDTGERQQLTDLPVLPGAHPSFDTSGEYFVSDGRLDNLGAPGEWGIVVNHVASQQSQLIHGFDDSQGSTSWRRAHPHPVFTADGQRIYYNISETPWVTLHVASVGTIE